MRLVPSVSSSPWLNDNICCVQCKCRRVERLWKLTMLHGHCLLYKELLTEYNNMVKDVRASYIANLISSSKQNPKVLFDTINNIVTPAPPAVPVFSNKDGRNFLSFFVDKITDVRASIIPSSTPFSAYPLPSPYLAVSFGLLLSYFPGRPH